MTTLFSLLVADALIACGGSADTPRAPLAEASVGNRPLRLTCTAEAVRYPGNPFPSGCTWTVAVAVGDELPLVLAEGPHGEACAEARSACDGMTGELAVRDDGGSYRVAAAYHGTTSGGSTQHLVDPGARWLVADANTGPVVADAKVDAMPALRDAIEQRLLQARDAAPSTERSDGLWALVADPLVAGDHVAALTDLARDCRLDEPVARALLQAEPTAVAAVYAGALKTSCYGQGAALGVAAPGTVQPLIAADLTARTGLPDAGDVALATLAADLGLKELAAPIAGRLLLAEAPEPLDANDPNLAAFVQLAGVVDRLEPEGATAARLAALAWAPGPAYTACEVPDGSQASTYTGYPPGFALAVAAGLRTHDSPPTRGALFKISESPAGSGAARQMARYLLASWRDPSADRLATVVAFNPCQQDRIARGD